MQIKLKNKQTGHVETLISEGRWVRETLVLTLQYMILGFATIPASLIGIGLMQFGMSRHISMAIAVCIAFAYGFPLWGFLEKRWLCLRGRRVAIPVGEWEVANVKIENCRIR